MKDKNENPTPKIAFWNYEVKGLIFAPRKKTDKEI